MIDRSELPKTTSEEMQFENGVAIGTCQLWHEGQYCAIITKAGIVGCAIYDLEVPAEFGQAIAICKGTPAQPLTVPQDLLEAKIVGVTPKAAEMGIDMECTGRQAVELMLRASKSL